MIAAGQLTKRNASRRHPLLLIEAEAGLDLLERVKLECKALNSNENHAMGFEGARAIVALDARRRSYLAPHWVAMFQRVEVLEPNGRHRCPSNDLPFSSERQGRLRAYHGREEPRAQSAASRHRPTLVRTGVAFGCCNGVLYGANPEIAHEA